MKKILIVSLFACLLIFQPASAQRDLRADVGGQLKAGGGKAGFEVENPKPPQLIVAEIIQIALGLVGMMVTGLIVLAGYWLITADGEQDQILKAKKTMTGAVIGLGIILSSYAITTFVAKRIQNTVSSDKAYEINENSYQAIPLDL